MLDSSDFRSLVLSFWSWFTELFFCVCYTATLGPDISTHQSILWSFLYILLVMPKYLYVLNMLSVD